MARRQRLRLGGAMKDSRAFVDEKGFSIEAPRFQGGKRLRGLKGRVIRWDELEDLDAELVRAKVTDWIGAFVNLFPVDSDLAESNPRGYVLLTFSFLDQSEEPIVVEIPRSLGWKPDAAWLRGFVERSRRAIADPEFRAAIAA